MLTSADPNDGPNYKYNGCSEVCERITDLADLLIVNEGVDSYSDEEQSIKTVPDHYTNDTVFEAEPKAAWFLNTPHSN